MEELKFFFTAAAKIFNFQFSIFNLFRNFASDFYLVSPSSVSRVGIE